MTRRNVTRATKGGGHSANQGVYVSTINSRGVGPGVSDNADNLVLLPVVVQNRGEAYFTDLYSGMGQNMRYALDTISAAFHPLEPSCRFTSQLWDVQGRATGYVASAKVRMKEHAEGCGLLERSITYAVQML